jgi:hypothetical protein
VDKSRAQLFTALIYEFSHNAKVFVLGKLFPAYSNKPSSLVRKLVTYGQKSFMTLAPGERLSITLAYIAPPYLTKEKKVL